MTQLKEGKNKKSYSKNLDVLFNLNYIIKVPNLMNQLQLNVIKKIKEDHRVKRRIQTPNIMITMAGILTEYKDTKLLKMILIRCVI